MKQTIAGMALLALSLFYSDAATAQQSKTATAASTDKVIMKDGKVMISKEGKLTQLKADMVTANGHIIKPNGTVVMNTGTSTTLKEGQVMGMDGKIETKAKANVNPYTGK